MYASPLSTGGTARQKEKLKNKIERLEAKLNSLRVSFNNENELINQIKQKNLEENYKLQQIIQESSRIEQEIRNEMYKRGEINREIKKQEQILANPSLAAEESQNQMELKHLNKLIDEIELDIQAKEEKIDTFNKKMQEQAASQQYRKSSIILDQSNLSLASLPQIDSKPTIELLKPTLELGELVSFEVKEEKQNKPVFHFDDSEEHDIPDLEDKEKQREIQTELKRCMAIFDAHSRVRDILNTTNANISRAKATTELAKNKKKEYLGKANNIEWLEHTRSHRHNTINQLDETIARYNKELSLLMKKQADLEQNIHLMKEQIARLQRRDTPDVPQLVGEMQSCKLKFKERNTKLQNALKRITEIESESEKLKKFLRPGVISRIRNEIDTLRYEKNQLKVKLSDLQKINQSEVKRNAEQGRAENSSREDQINNLIFKIGKLKTQRKNIEQTIEYTKIAIIGAGLHVPPMKERKRRVIF